MEASTLTACEVCGAPATGLLIDRRDVEFEGRTIESAIDHYCCKEHFGAVFEQAVADQLLENIRRGQETFHIHAVSVNHVESLSSEYWEARKIK